MLISIVIPVYNALAYLEKAINILCAGKSLEILLVDDGSTDGSGELCDQFADRDHRIKVIHQSNQGPGAARNAGIEKATGDWIYFMDADDELTSDGFEALLSATTEAKFDLHVFGFKVNENGVENIVSYKDKEIDFSEFGNYIVNDVVDVPYGNGFLWNKLYKRSIITGNSLRFCEEARIQEDELFNLAYLRGCRAIKIHSQILYCYNISNSGNSRSRYIGNYFECIEQVHLAFESILKDLNKAIPTSLYRRTLRAIMVNEVTFYQYHPDNHKTKKQRIQRLKQIGNSKAFTDSIKGLKRYSALPLEWSLYANAIHSGSITRIDILVKFFKGLRNLKNILKR